MVKIKNWAGILLCISLVFIIIGSAMGSYTQSAGNQVTVQDISFYTEDGAVLRALLYIPKSASPQSPAPAVVACHGYNNTAEVQSANCIELARRGYVVIAPDEYGHGGSSFASENGGVVMDMGAYAALQYLGTLPLVDTGNVGMVGHSMGGTAIQYAALRAWQARDLGESVVVPTAVLPTAQAYTMENDQFILEGYPINMGVVYGQYDEWAESMWGVEKVSQIASSPKMASAMGFYLAQDIYDQDYFYYGESLKLTREAAVNAAREGQLRALYQPAVTHARIHFSSEAVADVVEFFDITLRQGRSTIDSGSQIWFIKELWSGLALIGFFIFIGAFGALMLRTAFFKTLVRSEPQAPSKVTGWRSRAIYIGIFILCLLPAPLLYNWAMGYPINIPAMDRAVAVVFPANALFPMPVANGLVILNLLLAAITLGIFMLTYRFVMRRQGVTMSNLGILLPVKEVFKALALAAVVFGAGYGLLHLANTFFTVDFRFWVFSVKTITAPKAGMFLTYLPFFAVFFVVTSLTLNSFTRIRGAKEGVNLLLMCLASCGGLLVLTGIDYICLAVTGVKMFPYVPYPSGTTSALAGVLLWNLLFILPVSAVLSRIFFKKTGSIWLGGFVNAFVVTFFAVSNTVVSAGML